MNKKVILFGITAIVCTTLFTTCKEGSISGVVTKKDSNEPLAATGVELYKINKKKDNALLITKITTSDNGHYAFSNVYTGEYKLSVTAEGYKRGEYDVIVASGKAEKADMQLEVATGYVILTSAGLMVQETDAGSPVTWSTANSLCGNSIIGDYIDWRLPTQSELATLYNERNTIGGFITQSNNNSWYWSSTRSNYNYWAQDFSNGEQHGNYSNSNRCRCVRNY
jgi:5-hydroxyisourate hydrolase-like protein (transthyretin family)